MAETYPFHRFTGRGAPRARSGRYVCPESLVTAVNTALALERPLLIGGEAGVGKSSVAAAIAAELDLGEVLAFQVGADHRPRDLLYHYDAVRRLHDAQSSRDLDARRYVRLRALGQAIDARERRVVLVDEIDKGRRDFPNGLLRVLDRMEFTVEETGKTFTARHTPIVVVTTNDERPLPDPFLRRCVYHHLETPRGAQLKRILAEHLVADPDGPLDDYGRKLFEGLAEAAVERFEALRRLPGWDKQPCTAELVMWVTVLQRAGAPVDQVARAPLGELPFLSTLVKTHADLARLRRAEPDADP